MSEFTKMSVKQLKDYCRNNRIKGYSTLKKSELIVLVKKVNRKSNLVKKSRKPSRKPKKTSRKPKKTSRKPKKTSRKPKKTSRKPKKTSRKPKKTSRKPKKTSRKPKKVRKYKVSMLAQDPRTGPRSDLVFFHQVKEGGNDLKWETFLEYYHTPIDIINTVRRPYEKLKCIDSGFNPAVGKLYLHHVNGDFCCSNYITTKNEPQNWIMNVGIPMLKLKRNMPTYDEVQTVKTWLDDGQQLPRPSASDKFATFDHKYRMMLKYAYKLGIYTEFTNEFKNVMTGNFKYVIDNYIRYNAM
jgi:hypothetical protein